MSSVLLGLIGVALFIALAVAGAVYLGQNFDDAQVSARASNSEAAVSSVASAIGRYRFANQYQTGSALQTVDSLVTAGFLSAPPVNPSAAGNAATVVNAAGQDYATSGSSAFTPMGAAMSVGPDSALCAALEFQLGNISSEANFDNTQKDLSNFTPSRSGCYHSKTQTTQKMAAGDYVVYAMVG